MQCVLSNKKLVVSLVCVSPGARATCFIQGNSFISDTDAGAAGSAAGAAAAAISTILATTCVVMKIRAAAVVAPAEARPERASRERRGLRLRPLHPCRSVLADAGL